LPRNVLRCLLHSRAAALNQNKKNNHGQSSGNYSDYYGVIHICFPSCPLFVFVIFRRSTC
jgi:hypothetical protein